MAETTQQMRRRNAGQTMEPKVKGTHNRAPGFQKPQPVVHGPANQPNYDTRTNGGIPRRGGAHW